MKLVLGPSAKRTQQRDSLALMTNFASQDFVELIHGFDTEGALVQHHALDALSHGGVGDLGPRWSSGPRESVEDFGGPVDGQVSGFGQLRATKSAETNVSVFSTGATATSLKSSVRR